MAVKLLGMAVEQGDPNAMYGLASLYARGLGVDQSHEKASEFAKMAADRGHAVAQFNLGCDYYTGQSVDKSFELARAWCSLAAAQGYEKGG